jgi:pilus assembly protein CpaB
MTRRMLLLGLTLLLAAVGTGGVLLYARQADARAVAGKEAIQVLVAAKEVPAGTTVADARANGMLRTEIMPRQSVPTDTFFTDSDLAGLDQQVAAGDIVVGELLRRPMFVSKSASVSGLDVPAGKLVVSVSVSSAGEVAGYLKAGSMVSVFDTFTVAEGTAGLPAGDDLSRNHDYNQATRLLLPKVQVLAVGPAPVSTKVTTPGSPDVNAEVLVTVAVSQADAAKLVHGAQVGHLYLALVPDGTNTPSASVGVDNRTVFSAG